MTKPVRTSEAHAHESHLPHSRQAEDDEQGPHEDLVVQLGGRGICAGLASAHCCGDCKDDPDDVEDGWKQEVDGRHICGRVPLPAHVTGGEGGLSERRHLSREWRAWGADTAMYLSWFWAGHWLLHSVLCAGKQQSWVLCKCLSLCGPQHTKP